MPRSAELLRVLDGEHATAEGKAVNPRVELILDALRLAGIDPTNPPRYKQGTAAPHKKAALDALKDRMDRGAFDEAWQLCLDLNAIAKSMVKTP